MKSLFMCSIFALSASAVMASAPINTKLPDVLLKQISIDNYESKPPKGISKSMPSWEHVSVDLNSDGIADYIICHNDPNMCGSGGCSILIYLSSGSGFKSSYNGVNFYAKAEILKTKTKGCFDIKIKNESATGKINTHLLVFDGKEYQDKEK